MRLAPVAQQPSVSGWTDRQGPGIASRHINTLLLYAFLAGQSIHSDRHPYQFELSDV